MSVKKDQSDLITLKYGISYKKAPGEYKIRHFIENKKKKISLKLLLRTFL